MRRRLEYYQEMLAHIERNDDQFLRSISWTDESIFSKCGKFNRKNTQIWAPEDPRKFTEVNQQKRFSLSVWCGLLDRNIIVSYFYGGTFTGDRYIEFLGEAL